MMMTSITTAKRKKLLIVDDEQEIRSLLSDFLASYFEIETATNGDEAIKKAKIWQPEIMLMDVLMPVMNGMDAPAKPSAKINRLDIFLLSCSRH